MAKQWRFEATVQASPLDVYGWMSDFAEDDHAREAFVRGTGAEADKYRGCLRRVVSREGDRLVVEDTMGRQSWRMDVELRPAQHEVHMAGMWGYRAVWRALPEAAGTRVVVEAGLEPKGFARLFAPLFAGMLMKQMRADFDGHVADMREALVPR